jgi:PPK2 family polyphosphate:nucleotide phosphotransferase
MEEQLQFVYDLVSSLRVAPGKKISLHKDFDPGGTWGLGSRHEAEARLAEGIEMLVGYQDRLSAQDVHGVLVVLQGLDASGKDGTIKHVMSGLNPQGVEVRSFKQPSVEELNHDFLWRYQQKLPERGRIGIFNRSHYEEVLVVRVHPELLDAERIPENARKGQMWERRYRQINDWERHLVDNGVHVVKVFLNLSKQEQARRFLARIDDPAKNWKFSPSVGTGTSTNGPSRRCSSTPAPRPRPGTSSPPTTSGLPAWPPPPSWSGRWPRSTLGTPICPRSCASNLTRPVLPWRATSAPETETGCNRPGARMS